MIKQKILTFLCAALMSVGMWADPVVRQGDSWNGTTKTLTVNSNLPENAYRFDTEIEHVIISNSVTSVGYSAFYDCESLKSVTIGNSVTSIGNTAFAECSLLESVTIPNSVISIGDEAFYNCFGLTSVTIGNSVTSIGGSAFMYCIGLTSIKIPSSVTSIGTAAFAACFGLTSMEVASGNTNYDSRGNCNAIIEKSSNTLIAGCKNTIIPTNVTSIGMVAFFGCTGLTSITIPTSVTSIGMGAFEFCTGLTSIEIPNSVTSIGDEAFVMSGLTSATIGNSVTSIGEMAFAQCNGLTSIEIPNSVTSIGDRAFQVCSGLTSVTIGNSVTSIGEQAFRGDTGLTSITIPSSVTSIGADAFLGCTAVTDVYCYPNAANLTWNDGECNDFKASKATSCHVPANYYDAYVDKFGTTVNVTFVGDLPSETIIFNNLGLDNQYDLTTGPLTVGNIELNFAQNNGLNPPKFYTDGSAARIYSGNSMSISAGGATITKIVFNISTGTPTFDTGSYNATTSTWEGKAKTLTLSNEMASGQVRIVSMDIYYSDASAGFNPPTANTTDIHARTTTPLINAGSTTEEGATIKYLVTATNEQPTSTDGFSADVPTAQAITAPGTYYVWYYLDFATGDDSDIYPTAIQVTVAAAPTVTLKEGTEDADNWTITPEEAKTTGVAEGTEVTATYSGTKLVKSVKAVKKVTLDTPLTVEALTAGNIVVSNPKSGMQYSLNGGAKTPVTSDAINVTTGDKVAFYGDGTNISGYIGTYISGGTAQVKAYGNIMSLIDETGYATLTTLLNQGYVFYALFYGNTNLTDASGLLLPATTLAEGCYYNMFSGCTSLTTAPTLPATTLADYCYTEMFKGCTSLTTAPTLPATTLADYCYSNMFEGCTSLVTAPALPATTLAQFCYQLMFSGCTSLTTAPELPATTLANYCYNVMFGGCTSLTTAPALPAETLVAGCYYGMFDGCTSLNSVTCMATDITASGCTTGWLSSVAATGTFTKASGANWSTGNNGIPSGWSVENAPNN